MDFDTSDAVNEEELNELGIKKKNDADIDVDPDAIIDADEPVDPLLEEESPKEEEKGIFGDDAELEEYMLSGYDEK